LTLCVHQSMDATLAFIKWSGGRRLNYSDWNG
jgi:hypothetical protein